MEGLWVKHVFSRSFVWWSGLSKGMLIFFLFRIVLTMDYRAGRIISNTTYVLAWNFPSKVCKNVHDYYTDPSLYSLKGDPKSDTIGQNVTIYYVHKLGLYPHIDSVTQKENHGAIPQRVNITEHLEIAKENITHYLPVDQLGLSVINWEFWNPIWSRNTNDKTIYKTKSLEKVKQTNNSLTDDNAEPLAKKEFEERGKEFMLKTLQLGVGIRPKNYWGFYNYPECYNDNYKKYDNYTGSCPEEEKKLNDQLDWLWKESTALYPTIYLNTKLQRSPFAALFSRNRINEAIRLAKVRDPNNPLPVFAFVSPVFIDKSSEFLSMIDFVNTIGESFALGASGIIVSGNVTIIKNQAACKTLRAFGMRKLNRYLINVTIAAKMCHQALCQDRGFCTRKDWNSSDYLHLNPNNFFIKFGYCDKYIIFGEPSVEDLKQFSDKFDCSCFANMTCKKNENIESIKSVRVCINEEVCVSAYVNPESDTFPSKHNETLMPTTETPTEATTDTEATTTTEVTTTTTATTTTTTTQTTTTQKRGRIY